MLVFVAAELRLGAGWKHAILRAGIAPSPSHAPLLGAHDVFALAVILGAARLRPDILPNRHHRNSRANTSSPSPQRCISNHPSRLRPSDARQAIAGSHSHSEPTRMTRRQPGMSSTQSP